MKVVAACLLAIATTQGKVLYRTPDSSLIISNFTSYSGAFQEDGTFVFDAIGVPLKIESQDRGFIISAARQKGTIIPQRLPENKVSYIKEMAGEGSIVAYFDSQAAHDHLLARAIQDGGLVRSAPSGRDTAEIKSERFTFTGNAVDGTMSLPGAFTFTTTGQKNDSAADGKVSKTSHQSSIMTGSSGTVTLLLGAGIDRRVRTASVEGPITFMLDQVETTANSITPSVTQIKGWADRAEVDMVESKTITLIGNVRLQGERGVFLGTTEGDRAVITLDRDLKPSGIRITGEPTTSKLKEKKTGGGSR